MTAEICEVVITAEDDEWLNDFTRGLIEDRLAACAQDLALVRSIYRFKGGAINDEVTEARVVVLTRRSLVGKIIARMNAEYEYAPACVFARPIVEVNPDYAEWVVSETTEPAESS